MKWRSKSHFDRNVWHTGPESNFLYAKKNGVRYEVSAAYKFMHNVKSGICWWAIVETEPPITKPFTSQEEAITFCETHAKENAK